MKKHKDEEKELGAPTSPLPIGIRPNNCMSLVYCNTNMTVCHIEKLLLGDAALCKNFYPKKLNWKFLNNCVG